MDFFLFMKRDRLHKRGVIRPTPTQTRPPYAHVLENFCKIAVN